MSYILTFPLSADFGRLRFNPKTGTCFEERIPRNRPSPWLPVLVLVCTPGDLGMDLRRPTPLFTTWNICKNDTYAVWLFASFFLSGSVYSGKGVFQKSFTVMNTAVHNLITQGFVRRPGEGNNGIGGALRNSTCHLKLRSG